MTELNQLALNCPNGSQLVQTTQKELIDRLNKAGLNLSIDPGTHQLKGSALEGKSIVISGIFNAYSREELKRMVEAYGGKNTGSISSRTSFVLAGENMGPEKKKKAESLGIPLISEEDFLQMLGGKEA